MNNKTELSPDRQKGATMLEFSLVFGTVLLCVLVMIDVGRYFVVRSLISRAANSTLAKAQITGDLQIDFRGLNPASTAYMKFLTARRQILMNGIQLATMTMNAPSAADPSLTRLVEYKLTDPIAMLPQPTTLADMILLLPGQHSMVTSTGEMIYHPKLCAPGDGCAYGDVTPAMPFDQILYKYPIVVEIRTIFQPIASMIFPLNIPMRVRVSGPFQRASSALFPPPRRIPASVPPLP